MDNLQNLDVSSNASSTSYGKTSIIAAIFLTIVSWGIGIYSFSSAVDKEIDAYLQMQPGAFMIMAQKTLGSDKAITSAKQVVTDYYTYLNKEQYQAAYRLLAHREREKYGTYDQAYPNRMFVKMIYEHDTWRIEAIVPYDQKYEDR